MQKGAEIFGINCRTICEEKVWEWGKLWEFISSPTDCLGTSNPDFIGNTCSLGDFFLNYLSRGMRFPTI